MSADADSAVMLHRTRDRSLDLLKGSAVVLMIQVHILELFARQDVMDSGLGRILMFLGGPPVAPVFLAVLGFLALRTPVSLWQLLRRGGQLLLLGAFLNIGLNLHLLTLIYLGRSALNPWEYVFGVDVLFVAGLSLIGIGLLRPVFKKRVWAWAIASLLVASVAPELSDSLGSWTEWKWPLAYIASRSSWSYFPIFPWLAYPLLGVAAFHLRTRLVVSRWHLALAWGMILPILLMTREFALTISHDLPRYYHHGGDLFLWNVAFLVLWALLHRAIASASVGVVWSVRGWAWLGQNVTACYVVQWLLIGNIATAIYKTESLLHAGLWFITLGVLTSVLVYGYTVLPMRRRRLTAALMP